MSEFERNILYLAVAVSVAMVALAAFAIFSPKIPTKTLLQIIVGYKTPPIIVAAMRRGITFLSAALVAWAANALGIVEEPESLAKLAGAVAGAIEFFAWGLFDQLKKSHQNDTNPPAVAGSGGVSPTDGGIPDD